MPQLVRSTGRGLLLGQGAERLFQQGLRTPGNFTRGHTGVGRGPEGSCQGPWPECSMVGAARGEESHRQGTQAPENGKAQETTRHQPQNTQHQEGVSSARPHTPLTGVHPSPLPAAFQRSSPFAGTGLPGTSHSSNRCLSYATGLREKGMSSQGFSPVNSARALSH